MAHYVVKKPGESSEKSVNRFKKLTQRFVRDAKGDMHLKKDPRKRDVREKALMREKYRTERNRTQFYS